MKLAVIVATYWRKNNSSRTKLSRMFRCLREQTCQQFKVFIVGDNYEKREEFNSIVKAYSGPIYSHNNTRSFRKNTFSNKTNRWTCGGMLARYHGITKAIEEGYEYYLHLDDDDTWTRTHIQEFVHCIESLKKVDFAVTVSKYKRNMHLPREHKQIKTMALNNWKPQPKNSVHSSWCVNLKTLGPTLVSLYRGRLDRIERIAKKQVREPLLSPFDAHILTELRNMQAAGRINCVLIPKVTCEKQSDGNIPA